MSEEYFDVVDENNVVIGQERRRIVHQTGLWHRGSHVFLFTSDRRLVVQRRSQTKDVFPGALDCSVSEHLQVGECYADGAIRGLREELGVKPIPLRRLLQFKMTYGPNDNMVSELYEAVYDGQSLTIDPDETEKIDYHTIPEIEEMMVAGQAAFAPWFVQLFSWYLGKPANMEILWHDHETLNGKSGSSGICSQRDARARPAFFSFVIPRNEESLGLQKREIPRSSE